MGKATFTLTDLAADSTSRTFQVPADKPYAIYQNITTVTTDDTLDTTVEESPDGGTTWITAATFTQVTAASSEKEVVQAGHAPLQRLNLNVTVVGAAAAIDGVIYVIWPD